jgi:hypothetical protein
MSDTFNIQLTNSPRQAVIDARDAAKVLAVGTWRMNSGGYAEHTSKRNGRILMHQLIAGKPGKGMVVDHINGRRLDNRRENLRIVTVAANSWNRPAQVWRGMVYRGISFNENTQQWRVAFQKNGRRYSLGRYESLFQAQAAATLGMAALYGRHAQFYDHPLLGRTFDEVCAKADLILAILPKKMQAGLLARPAGFVPPPSVVAACEADGGLGVPNPFTPKAQTTGLEGGTIGAIICPRSLEEPSRG